MACVPAGRVLMPTRCSTAIAAISVSAVGGQDSFNGGDTFAAPHEPHGRPRQAKRDEKVRNCLPHPASGMSQKHARSAYACQRPHLLICQTWAATSIPSGLSQLVSQMISRTQAQPITPVTTAVSTALLAMGAAQGVVHIVNQDHLQFEVAQKANLPASSVHGRPTCGGCPRRWRGSTCNTD